MSEAISNLPWEVRQDENIGIWVSAPNELVQNPGNLISQFPREIMSDEDYEKKLADAQYIVKAVNSLAALQAAGDALAEDVERILAERERQLDGCSDDFKAIATQKLRTKLAAWNQAKEMR